MKVKFTKYQGTGNDFILINELTHKGHNKLGQHNIRRICDRNFGVGADGLIYLNESRGFDFEMEYFNSDGLPSTMCGNGGRCAVAFAQRLGVINNSANFSAVDGPHTASFIGNQVALGMQDVNAVQSNPDFFQLNTGSPHYVTFVPDANAVDVDQAGAAIRNSPPFSNDGINVNFVQENANDRIFVRTYERGVEAETLSCGTGVTAASIVQMMRRNLDTIHVETLGGELQVQATNNANSFSDVKLIGPAQFVFEGEFDFT